MHTKTNPGLLIVCDGPDYSGKSTTIQLLHDYLKNEKNINSVITKHPGSTWIGQKIRQIVKDPESKILSYTRAMLFAIDNIAFQEEIAKPLEQSNDWVLSDRNNFISAFAYQTADNVSHEELAQIHSSLINPRKIDHVFILDIDWETRQKRMAHREAIEGKTNDYYERDKLHFESLRKSYLRLHEKKQYLCKYINYDDDYMLNIHYIDANKDAQDILKQILKKLGL